MTKGKNNDPQPQNELDNVTAEAASAVAGIPTENVVSIGKGKSNRKNFFEREDVAVTAAAQSKVSLVQTVRSQVSEAAKLADEGEENNDRITELSQSAAFSLYQGMTAGIIQRDEATAILGDGFGYKGKGDLVGQRVTAAEPDATRSKTPYGWGEHIRKRVVRAVSAYHFTNGDISGAGAFFKGLEPKDVAPLVNQLNAGDLSIWTVYDKLGEKKADVTGTRPPLAFDPKRIAGLTAALGENIAGTVERMGSTRGLPEAYLGLFRMLNIIGREMPDEAEEAA